MTVPFFERYKPDISGKLTTLQAVCPEILRQATSKGNGGMRMADEIWAVTGDSVAHLTRQGEQWNVSVILPGSRAQCLVQDPRQPARFYVGTRGNGVWKSTNGGSSWEECRLPQADVFSLAISPADGSLYVGTEPSHLFRSQDEGLTWEELSALRKIPSAPTWSFPPRPWTSHVRWIAPNPQRAELLLVGIELGGLMRSQDGGATWEDHRPGAQRDVHALAWHPSAAGVAYEAGGGGAAWSHDWGETWQPAERSLDRHYVWGLAIDPVDAQTWFISASTGPGPAHGGADPEAALYRWCGAHGPWQALSGGLPEPLPAMPYALATDESAGVYAGTGHGEIYASQDRGDSWQRLTLRGERLPSIVALLVGK
jgi:photosystem II stability/assembly factor-like uncharacterized protein